MSLDVLAPEGLGASAEQAIHETWDTLDTIRAMIAKAGLQEMDKPVYQLQRIEPTKLSNATSQQFSVWFMMYESWHGYYAQHINWAVAKRLEVTNEMKILGAKIRKERRQDKPKPSEDAIADMVLTDPRYIELLRQEQQYKQYELQLEPPYDHVKKTIALLSRHVAVRQLEAEISGRTPRQYGAG
jgi:hypothetical protein